MTRGKIDGYHNYEFFVDGESCGGCYVPADDVEYNYYMDAGQLQRETRKRVEVYKNGIHIDTL